MNLLTNTETSNIVLASEIVFSIVAYLISRLDDIHPLLGFRIFPLLGIIVLTDYFLYFNDAHREKLCFTQFSIRIAAWLLLTFFIYLHDQLTPIHFIITYRCLKKVIHQIENKNEWLLLLASFTAKFELVFFS